MNKAISFREMLMCPTCNSVFFASHIRYKNVVMRNDEGYPLYEGECPICEQLGRWCGS